MKVALVHDWLTGMRGGERVLEVLCDLYPEATLFTLFHHAGSVSRRIESHPICASFLNRMPGAKTRYRYFLPLFPLAIRSFDLAGFDLVLSSSHAVAKGVRKPAGSLHICYCHTPMRYIWDMREEYFHYGDMLGLKRVAVALLGFSLRAWDRSTSKEVDCFVANSRHVQERIERYYRRSAWVLHPPVNTEFFVPGPEEPTEDYYLVVSALVPYKRIDLAVDAFNRLARPLVIAGTGPDLEILRRRARSNIEFKGFVSDAALRTLYQRCRALVFPGREDFGIAPLEANACGRPVVAFASGGLLESMAEGDTGVFFTEPTSESLAAAVQRLEAATFEPQALRKNAERFSVHRFRSGVRDIIEKARTSLG